MPASQDAARHTVSTGASMLLNSTSGEAALGRNLTKYSARPIETRSLWKTHELVVCFPTGTQLARH